MSKDSSARGRRGQLGSCESHVAAKLACMIGVSGLRHLTDEEVETLVDIAQIAIDQVYADGFSAGQHWQAVYNYDRRLLCEGPPTNH